MKLQKGIICVWRRGVEFSVVVRRTRDASGFDSKIEWDTLLYSFDGKIQIGWAFDYNFNDDSEIITGKKR